MRANDIVIVAGLSFEVINPVLYRRLCCVFFCKAEAILSLVVGCQYFY